MTELATIRSNLWIPEGWFDLLGDEPEQAEHRLGSMLQSMLVNATDEQLALLTRGLLAWRENLIRQDFILNGIVSVPSTAGEAAEWQILARPYVLSQDQADSFDEPILIDVFARWIATISDNADIETFPSAMGLGIGTVYFPEVPALAGLPGDEARTVGMTLALSVDQEAGLVLVVSGMCLNPEQIDGLVALVANIAARSTLAFA